MDEIQFYRQIQILTTEAHSYVGDSNGETVDFQGSSSQVTIDIHFWMCGLNLKQDRQELQRWRPRGNA